MSPDEQGAEEELKEGEDYYMDGPYLVFTAVYHLKRGYCCASRCRHCPYQEQNASSAQPARN